MQRIYSWCTYSLIDDSVRHCSTSFTSINWLLKGRHNRSPFYRRENWGTEKEIKGISWSRLNVQVLAKSGIDPGYFAPEPTFSEHLGKVPQIQTTLRSTQMSFVEYVDGWKSTEPGIHREGGCSRGFQKSMAMVRSWEIIQVRTKN